MTFALFAVLTAAPRWVSGNEEDDALLAALITTVALHDIAIIAGVSPTPLIQYGAETVELAANIRLKYYPAWLQAPRDIAVDPATPSPNASYSADGCGIEFELLSPKAEYENLFGVVNFRDPYVDPRTSRVYPWFNLANPNNTRWGFLQPPSALSRELAGEVDRRNTDGRTPLRHCERYVQ